MMQIMSPLPIEILHGVGGESNKQRNNTCASCDVMSSTGPVTAIERASFKSNEEENNTVFLIIFSYKMQS